MSPHDTALLVTQIPLNDFIMTEMLNFWGCSRSFMSDLSVRWCKQKSHHHKSIWCFLKKITVLTKSTGLATKPNYMTAERSAFQRSLCQAVWFSTKSPSGGSCSFECDLNSQFNYWFSQQADYFGCGVVLNILSADTSQQDASFSLQR